MATLETQHIFQGNLNKVFAAIGQYEKYSSYLPAVTSTRRLPPQVSGSNVAVRYELNLIKTFYYVLNMFEVEPNHIHWSLQESNIMTLNNGSWDFTADGDHRTKAIYRAEIKFKGLIPSKITDQVIKSNVDGMFAGFQKLIDAYGGNDLGKQI